jgi:hypothetical protein
MNAFEMHLKSLISSGAVKTLAFDFLELMRAFDFLCLVMNQTTIQSVETIDQFGLVAKWFGVKY